MATPPTRVLFAQPSTNWALGATKTTTSFNVVTGDLIVVKVAVENADDPVTVTPSASGGSVTWTLRATQSSGNNTTALGYCWTGAVGATATGITVSVARPHLDDINWGMTATLWRGHGGVGVAFSANNATGSGAPNPAATCAANSGVEIMIADWNAIATARTWRTINGSAETEAAFHNNAAAYTVLDGYRVDTGTAGSITQGVTAPSTMRWVAVGVEILGTSGGTDHVASPADALGATDSLAPVATADRTQADALGATDSLAPVAAGVRAQNDAAGLTDVLQAVLGTSVAVSDSLGVTDSLVVSISRVVQLADTLGITDTDTEQTIDYVVDLADGLGATDSLARAAAAVRSVADALGAADSLSPVAAAARTVSDNLGAVDALGAELTGSGTVSAVDALGVTDTATAVVAAVRTLTDSAGGVDELVREIAAARGVTDTAGATDSLAGVLTAARGLAETLGMTDALNVVLTPGGELRDIDVNVAAIYTTWLAAAAELHWAVGNFSANPISGGQISRSDWAALLLALNPTTAGLLTFTPTTAQPVTLGTWTAGPIYTEES